jgi:hypothetical protein
MIEMGSTVVCQAVSEVYACGRLDEEGRGTIDELELKFV